MDQAHAVLVGFPYPSTFDNIDVYHKSILAHRKNLDRLTSSPGWSDHAPQLLELIHPAVHSLSYLVVLNTVKASNAYSPDALLEKITRFVASFDQRQLRYGGRYFTRLLQQPRLVDLFPPPVATDLVSTALLRLDPSASVLTNHHCDILRFAYMTCSIDAVLPLLEKKNIVFYPGMKGSNESRPPCDPELPPVGFITIENEFTTALSAKDILEHDFLRGLCFVYKRQWQQAFDSFERVITYPLKDNNACSKIMAEAYNKWVLVGVLLTGKAPVLPAGITSAGAAKQYATLGKPYLSLAQAFEKDKVEALLSEFNGVPNTFWEQENNFELVRLVLARYQSWQIISLGNIYSKISLEDVRKLTQSAETGGPLESVDDVARVVQSIIDEQEVGVGMKITIETPQDGGVPYLVFSDVSEQLDEGEYARRMTKTVKGLQELGPLIKATNEWLATSKDYVKALAHQKRTAENSTVPASELFEDQVDDEDLMTGLAMEA